MMGCLKTLAIAAGLILIAGAVAGIYLLLQADAYSRIALERGLRYALGVDITTGNITIHPLDGRFVAHDIVIGNPPAFKPGPAIEIQRLSIEFQKTTLFSKSPTIRRMILEGVRFHLHHEIGQGTNLGALAKQAAGSGQSGAIHGRSFVLRELRCEEARMRMSSNLLPIGSAGINLAPFTLADLGDRPVSIGGIAAILMRSVFREAITLKGLLNPVIRLLQDESSQLDTTTRE